MWIYLCIMISICFQFPATSQESTQDPNPQLDKKSDTQSQPPTLTQLIDAIWEKDLSFLSNHEINIRETYRLPQDLQENARNELVDSLAIHDQKIVNHFQELIVKYPRESDPVLALGNFYDDRGKEHIAFKYWSKAKNLNPSDPAVWNNLASFYTHNGEIQKSFKYFEKSLDLEPDGWIYYHNFANTVFLFRKDVKEYYKLNEQQVFDKAFELYELARKQAPENFELAEDIAKSYYIVRPYRVEKALQAWKQAFEIADSDHQKQSVMIHQSRWLLRKGLIDDALNMINQVSLPDLISLKVRVKKTILKKRENI